MLDQVPAFVESPEVAGTWHSLSRLSSPPPQVREQEDQGLHGDQAEGHNHEFK